MAKIYEARNQSEDTRIQIFTTNSIIIIDANDSNWMVVHSRSVALFVALKQATECLLDGDSNREAVITTLLAHASSDKVPSRPKCL